MDSMLYATLQELLEMAGPIFLFFMSDIWTDNHGSYLWERLFTKIYYSVYILYASIYKIYVVFL